MKNCGPKSINRYSRQIIFSEIGQKGQERLKKTVVGIVGVGGLGSTVAQLLARAGVGKLILIDFDKVDDSNLQRQLLYKEDDIGREKAICAKELLEKINSEIKIESHVMMVNDDTIDSLKKADIIVDCTDNLDTRFVINKYCVKNKKPWVYASVAGSSGFVKTFLPGKDCFNCIFDPRMSSDNCSTIGIANFAVSLVASIQAGNTLKLLLKKDATDKDDSLLHIDAWHNAITKIKTKKKTDCPVCGTKK
jgi:molybdopterin/thiamine biosynthesis adenylyltransferase